MRLSIVLPAFNEAKNIEGVVEKIRRTMASLGFEYEIIIVNDGSNDATQEVLSRISSDPHSVIVTHERNFGYGRALRSGFERARFEWLFFMDADSQFDVGEIRKLIPYADSADIIVGFRKTRQDSLIRSVNSGIFNAVVRLCFGLGHIKDVNCAFKLMRTSLVQSFQLEAEGALINVELFIRARQRALRIIEVPVSHYPRLHGVPTGAKPRVIIRAFVELARLYFRVHRP